MKKIIRIALTTLMLLSLFGCSQKEPSVVKTYEKTDSELAFENDELVTMVKYYEMSDGTWKTDDYTYQYRLEITGRTNAAVKDTTFVFLSNIEDITFEQAWKASGFSSNMDDYFDIEDAKFVAFSTSKNYGVDTLAENIPMYSSDDLLYREFSAGFELEKGTDILIERKYVENALENAVAIAIVLNGNIYKEVPLEETDIEFTLDKSGNYVFMAVNSVGKTVDITSAIRAEKSADGGVILLN